MSRLVRGALPRAAFAAAVVVSLLVLFLPASGVPTAPPGTDKVVHLLVFAALAVTGRWAGWSETRLAVALVAYAVLMPFVLVWGGEHYVVDTLLGAAYAVGIVLVMPPLERAGRRAFARASGVRTALPWRA